MFLISQGLLIRFSDSGGADQGGGSVYMGIDMKHDCVGVAGTSKL